MNTADTRHREADGESDVRAGGLPRLLPQRLSGPASWEEHRARYGALPVPGRDDEWPGQFIAEVGRSGLTGRGGASFPTARKLRAVAAGRDAPVVIANGTEGEPASAKDKVLLAREPHLVLDGTVLAAHLAGARQAFVVVHETVREIVDRAAAERKRARRDGIRLKVMTGADRFVGGEAAPWSTGSGTGSRCLPRHRPGSSSMAWMAAPRWSRTWRRWLTWRSSGATGRSGSARSALRPSPGPCW